MKDQDIIIERDSLIAENIDMYGMSEEKVILYVRPRVLKLMQESGMTKQQAVSKWKELIK